jgi:hypothetical protein
MCSLAAPPAPEQQAWRADLDPNPFPSWYHLETDLKTKQ